MMANRTPVGPKSLRRDVIWAEIRKQREFTRRSLGEATNISKGTISDYLQALKAAGVVRHTGAAKDGAYLFTLVKDRGVRAPQPRKDGSEVKQISANEAMWNAMRLLKQFTARDLALHASTEVSSVSEKNAAGYCWHLTKARYLGIVTFGRSHKPAVYRFVRFTGPKPPMILRTGQVFDANTAEIMWTPGVKGDGR